MIDKSKYVWAELMKISTDFVEKNVKDSGNLLKMEGEIDKVLKKWEVPKGGRKV